MIAELIEAKLLSRGLPETGKPYVRAGNNRNRQDGVVRVGEK